MDLVLSLSLSLCLSLYHLHITPTAESNKFTGGCQLSLRCTKSATQSNNTLSLSTAERHHRILLYKCWKQDMVLSCLWACQLILISVTYNKSFIFFFSVLQQTINSLMQVKTFIWIVHATPTDPPPFYYCPRIWHTLMEKDESQAA